MLLSNPDISEWFDELGENKRTDYYILFWFIVKCLQECQEKELIFYLANGKFSPKRAKVAIHM